MAAKPVIQSGNTPKAPQQSLQPTLKAAHFLAHMVSAGLGAAEASVVFTHHPCEPIEMDGGSTFYFVTDGIIVALDQARRAAGDKDVQIGGGVSTIRQDLQAGLIDEMHLAVSPMLLGSGEALLAGIDLPGLGYGLSEHGRGECHPRSDGRV